MAAPANELSFDFEGMDQAAKTWRQRTPERERNVDLVKRKQYDQVESKERMAKRVNRLLDKVKRTMPLGVEALPADLEELVERGPIMEDEIDNLLFERVIGTTRDFLSIEFLERGFQANRCVGRIVRRLDGGRMSFGTGFLVSPHLLMTNWHVLKSSEQAAVSAVELDFQLDRFGAPLTIRRFQLDPAVFFLNDKDLDFALVAIKDSASNGLLKDRGWCPLIVEEGKITVGNCVNIIQHPRGEMKQIVIRENELVDILERVLHYQGDTEPGSSGSPVFNDQWEVVGLHHSSIPKTDADGRYLDIHGGRWKKGDDPNLLAWVSNEGIRVSRLVNFISQATVRNHEKKLWEEFLEAKEPPRPVVGPAPEHPEEAGREPKPRNPAVFLPEVRNMKDPVHPQPGAVTLTIPLHITVTLGTPVQPADAQAQVCDAKPSEDFLEAIEPDQDYDNRPGYQTEFLGFSVPMPKLRSSIAGKAVEVSNGSGSGKNELKYHHYSVILNRERRLAFVAAVNFDAGASVRHRREGKDRWFRDPRIPQDFQTNNSHYADNPLDRGHLVRRADAAWGETREEAKLANDDTFHFPNCSPQHAIFNQPTLANDEGLLLWGNLEEHIAEQARNDNKKLCIFNGPIFRSNDQLHRELRIPQEFWKIVVFEKENGDRSALAFLLSQKSLIQDLPEEEFEVGPYQPFQVKVRDIEDKTKLDFGKLRELDPLEDEENESFFESGTEAVPLGSRRDIVF